MKTTIDLDERRLKAVMKLTGLRTRKAVVDPRYDLASLRKRTIIGALP
jgi:hypothetical protein